MVDYRETVKKDFEKEISPNDIARKIFLTFPTFAFENKEDIQFEILNKISRYFSIPITSVQIAGSAKVGRSYHKDKEFSCEHSDLDVVIIDNNIFRDLMETCCQVTRGFQDATKFSNNRDVANRLDFFKSYLLKGIIIPKNMPNTEKKESILRFFNGLSVEYVRHFKDINVAFYLSSYFFERKQLTTIYNIKNHIQIGEHND